MVRIFPLESRIAHLHTCKELRGLQSWRSKHRSTDGMLRSVIDGDAMKTIQKEYPGFLEDPNNLLLGGSSDGFSPWRTTKNAYSMWPVLLVNYNIPPWLTIKKEHIMLAVLIPGNTL